MTKMRDGSRDTLLSEKRSIIKRHIHSWEPEFPKALVFDPWKPEVVTTEEVNELCSTVSNSHKYTKSDLIVLYRGNKPLRGSATELA